VLTRPDSFTPPLDITRTRKKFVVHLDTPGLRSSDISLERKNNTTLIRGRRPPHFEEGKCEKEGCKAEKQERKYGDFSVTVSVPMAYQNRWSSCVLKDGVLTIEYASDTDELPASICERKIGNPRV